MRNQEGRTAVRPSFSLQVCGHGKICRFFTHNQSSPQRAEEPSTGFFLMGLAEMFLERGSVCDHHNSIKVLTLTF
jgi:hypothetical protein